MIAIIGEVPYRIVRVGRTTASGPEFVICGLRSQRVQGVCVWGDL